MAKKKYRIKEIKNGNGEWVEYNYPNIQRLNRDNIKGGKGNVVKFNKTAEELSNESLKMLNNKNQ